MALVTEYLNRGLVTARTATALREGEVQRSNECVYRAHDPSIYRAPGRSVYNTTTIKDADGTACPVKGLVWLPFDNTRTDQFLALGGNGASKGTLWAGDFTTINGTATFSRLTGPGQVTDVVTNGVDGIVTSASGGFAFMVQGARVTGSNIPANTVVSTVTSANQITLSKTPTSATTITATFDMGIAITPIDTGEEILDAVQWGSAYYAFTGLDVTRRIFYKGRSLDATALTDLLIGRSSGLAPVVLPPTVAVVAGAWSSVLGNGYYWFLITEAYNPGQPDEVEGTYTAKDDKGTRVGPVAANITAFATQSVQITRPAQVNTGTATVSGRISTHWYVYMSPKQADNVTTPSLATFRRVATVPMTATSITLTDSSTVQTKYPTAVTSHAARPQWTSPSSMLNAPDSVSATGTLNVINKLQTFGFSTGAPYNTPLTVTGIKITLFGVGAVNVYLTTTGGKTSGPLFMTQSSGYGTFTLGDQFNTHGVSWAYTDFANGTFEVLIESKGVLALIDAVQITVYYSGTSVNLNGTPFRIVTYRDQIGNTLDVPARLPPPVSSTGDTFQGSLVVNDIADETVLRWSVPGEPEAYPDPYVLAFRERRHNKVTFIRRVGQILVVGMRDAVKRVNYLPSELDSSFQEGLAHEDIASDHGVVGPLAGTLFTMPGSGVQMLAYVANNGLHITDGVISRFLNVDIKWSLLVDPTNQHKCILRDYPKEQWLVLYYPPVGGNGTNSRALVFCYSQDKVKDGGFIPAIGPVSVGARCAAEAILNGQHYIFTGHHSGGLIYTEDNGTTIPVGYTSDGSTVVIGAPAVRTRRIYPAGIDRSAREERIYVQYTPTGSLQAKTCTLVAGSAVVTMASTTGLAKGMLAVSANIPGDAIILTVDSGVQVTLSKVAFTAGTVSVNFDNSTLAVTVRRQNIQEAVTECDTGYISMVAGNLLVSHVDNQGQALELDIDKVIMPDDTYVDAGVDMRLDFFAYDAYDAGKEQNRAGS